MNIISAASADKPTLAKVSLLMLRLARQYISSRSARFLRSAVWHKLHTNLISFCKTVQPVAAAVDQTPRCLEIVLRQRMANLHFLARQKTRQQLCRDLGIVCQIRIVDQLIAHANRFAMNLVVAPTSELDKSAALVFRAVALGTVA